ncbi:5-oxoprolinase subunit PxpB [Halomonas sp. TD01]|uniref:5-oxoprolinase subunit PxpB n=1 Tax=Halomonas sp. TD01 TaxID=999141 RepID=UPI000214F536|nr:5-oxoprolinase subunit PxpB [Halomonas sp. TD01]EGP20007.1 allophanate hydrolase subunit 1 [Halomonas sp. TD01]CAH1043049.1 Allophanate hydrolase 2 subunit 1 (EC [Halomonas sp. TD01]
MKLRLETAAMDALTVRLFDTIDESNMAWIIAADQALRDALGEALIDLIPSYTTLLVHYDCHQLTFSQVTTLIRSALHHLAPAESQNGQLHEIPVWYDESVGPELPLVAKRAGLSVDALIEHHCNHDYCVFALGFAPGYGFMGLVDEGIATPRLKTPRRKVAAGSVGIADRQTAIYPLLSPGGWNILGRTAVPLFEYAKRGEPLLRPGDKVRFKAIGKAEFEASGGDTTPMEERP